MIIDTKDTRIVPSTATIKLPPQKRTAVPEFEELTTILEAELHKGLRYDVFQNC